MPRFRVQVSGDSIEEAVEALEDAADVGLVSTDELWSGAKFEHATDPGRAARVVVVDVDSPPAADERVRALLAEAALDGYNIQVLGYE